MRGTIQGGGDAGGWGFWGNGNSVKSGIGIWVSRANRRQRDRLRCANDLNTQTNPYKPYITLLNFALSQVLNCSSLLVFDRVFRDVLEFLAFCSNHQWATATETS